MMEYEIQGIQQRQKKNMRRTFGALAAIVAISAAAGGLAIYAKNQSNDNRDYRRSANAPIRSEMTTTPGYSLPDMPGGRKYQGR